MEFVRVEVRKIKDGELPKIILPRAGGHNRSYVRSCGDETFSFNVMCIGDVVDGVTYGEVDAAISGPGGPAEYFSKLTYAFLQIALNRGLGDTEDAVAFLAEFDPGARVMIRLIERQHKPGGLFF